MDLSFDELPSNSPYIETIWHSRSELAEPFISMADARSGLVVTRFRGKTALTVRGPETSATPAVGHAGAEFLGVRFKPGVFLRGFPPVTLMDRRDVELPRAGHRTFWLDGCAWEYPVPGNIEVFIDRLVREELLLSEPAVREALHGHPVDLSVRTVQRRFLQATGLTNNSLFQIERARRALALLKGGTSILETVAQAGYFDQPHLTRALKRFVGLTPAEILRPDRGESLSFLYKTTSFEDATLWRQVHSSWDPRRA